MASVFPTLDISKPDATAQNITQMGQSMVDQQTYLRACVSSGTLAGYSMATSGGTAEQPAVITYTKSAEKIRETITWGTTGGATGNPQAILYEYSSDTGATWATIGTLTYTYDASGNCTAGTWS